MSPAPLSACGIRTSGGFCFVRWRFSPVRRAAARPVAKLSFCSQRIPRSRVAGSVRPSGLHDRQRVHAPGRGVGRSLPAGEKFAVVCMHFLCFCNWRCVCRLSCCCIAFVKMLVLVTFTSRRARRVENISCLLPCQTSSVRRAPSLFLLPACIAASVAVAKRIPLDCDSRRTPTQPSPTPVSPALAFGASVQAAAPVGLHDIQLRPVRRAAGPLHPALPAQLQPGKICSFVLPPAVVVALE